MRHWTPPPTPKHEPARKPWEIVADVLGVLLLMSIVLAVTWSALAPAVRIWLS